MKILWKCRCMQDQAEVEVAERLPDQDIVHWVEQTVAAAVTRAHASLSPVCRATRMEFVKIPAPENAPFLGAAPKLDS